MSDTVHTVETQTGEQRKITISPDENGLVVDVQGASHSIIIDTCNDRLGLYVNDIYGNVIGPFHVEALLPEDKTMTEEDWK